MRKIYRIVRQSLNGEQYDFTEGSLKRALALLSIPMILEMIMESLFALVDAFFVARISADAMATVGLTESVITIVYSLAIGLSTAPVAMISRFIGEKDTEQASRTAKQAIYLGVSISILISVSGLYFAEDILRMMGGSEELIRTGLGYTQIMFASNIVIVLLFLLNGIFRGAGEAALAMRSLWIANGINIVLDPIFIFGIGSWEGMGVAGAAVATTIGRACGVSYQMYLLLSGRSVVKLMVGSWQLNWNLIKRLGRIAITGALQYIIASASWIFLMRINAYFGSAVVAGYTIAIRLILFTLLPAWGLSNAAATLVGQNLGAKQPERAEQSVWQAAHLTAGFLAVVSIFYLLLAPQLIRFFDDSVAVVDAGVTTLRIFAIGYVIYGYGMILSQAFNGAGDTRTPTVMNVISFWFTEIPLGYFLAIVLGWGVGGVATAVIVAECVMTILAIVWFRRGKWKETVV